MSTSSGSSFPVGVRGALVLYLAACIEVAPAQVGPVAEAGPEAGIVEVTAGETIHIQLMNSTPTGRPVEAVRVPNPNRNYLVARFTLEEAGDGAGPFLKVFNGYDNLLYFATGCRDAGDPSAAAPGRPRQLLIGIRPGMERRVEIPSGNTKIALCAFSLALS